MSEDDESLGKVKLHNKSVSKYDAYLEEIETRLNVLC